MGLRLGLGLGLGLGLRVRVWLHSAPRVLRHAHVESYPNTDPESNCAHPNATHR